MTILKRKYYDGDQEINDTEPYPGTIDDAYNNLERVFHEDPDVAVLERKKHADGSRSVSIKGQDNKIRLQYRTIQP